MSRDVPKQFKHWCRLHGIHPLSGSAGTHYFRSKRHALYTPYRHFRITCHDMFQICDGNFDKWGNSVGFECPLPQSKAEFDSVMKIFDAMSEINVPDKQVFERWLKNDLDEIKTIQDEKREWVDEIVWFRHNATHRPPSAEFMRKMPAWRKYLEWRVRRADRDFQKLRKKVKWQKKALATIAFR